MKFVYETQNYYNLNSFKLKLQQKKTYYALLTIKKKKKTIYALDNVYILQSELNWSAETILVVHFLWYSFL